MTQRPPGSKLTDTLLPYTTLFRSDSTVGTLIKIGPMRIVAFDQFQFPRAPPFLDRLFPCDSLVYVGEGLRVYQTANFEPSPFRCCPIRWAKSPVTPV